MADSEVERTASRPLEQSAPPVGDDGPTHDQVLVEVRRRAALVAPKTMLTSPIGALFVLAAAWSDASGWRLLAWTLVFMIGFAAHLGAALHARSVVRQAGDTRTSYLEMTRVLNGFCWGMAAPILAPDAGATELRLRLVLVLAVVGVSGGIVIAGGARAVAEFIASLGAPLLVLFALDGGSLTGLIVPGVVVAVALTVLYGTIWNRGLYDATEAQLRAAALAERLELQYRRSEESARQHQQLHGVMSEMARRDDLTGLLNRRGFFSAFMALDEHSEQWHVALLDLDHFKSINDEFGHSFGDEALRHVASVLDRVTPKGSVLGRLGGEEFALVLGDVPKDHMIGLVEQMRRAMDAAPPPEGRPLTVSVGISSGGRSLGVSIDQALSRADRAMYRAKAQGRDAVVLDEFSS